MANLPIRPHWIWRFTLLCIQCFCQEPDIDWDALLNVGLVSAHELSPLRSLSHDAVDYGELYQIFWPLAYRVAKRWQENPIDLDRNYTFENFKTNMLFGSMISPYSECSNMHLMVKIGWNGLSLINPTQLQSKPGSQMESKNHRSCQKNSCNTFFRTVETNQSLCSITEH